MGRGKLKSETVRQRAQNKALEWLKESGASLDSLQKVEEAPIEKPAETRDDKVREAQSVLHYFATRGAGFKQKVCKYCHQVFAYKWNTDSIGYCSIACMSESLKLIGIKWDPDKDQAERWGKFAPAVVPPRALEILEDLLSGSPEDLPSDTPE